MSENSDWMEEWKKQQEIHRNCFRLGEIEMQNFKQWNEKHLAEHHKGKEPYAGAAGGRLSWIFTPTSLGVFISVRCAFPDCRGEEHGITDLDSI